MKIRFDSATEEALAGQFQRYVIPRLGYSEETREAVKEFFDAFNEEYNSPYEKRRYPDLVKRAAEYIKGVPSVCSIDLDNYLIRGFANCWACAGKQARDTETGRALTPEQWDWLWIEDWPERCAEAIISLGRYAE